MKVCDNCYQQGATRYQSGAERRLASIEGDPYRQAIDLCEKCRKYLDAGDLCGMFDRHRCPSGVFPEEAS